MQQDTDNWLLSPAGEQALEVVQSWQPDERLQRLSRCDWTREQQRALLAMVELRVHAVGKLDCPEFWWLTRRGLEQSSGTLIARYKSTKFSRGNRLLDLCSGIGGDLISLAQVGTVISVDRDPRLIRFQEKTAANFGCREQIEFRCCDVEFNLLPQVDAWHLDPDRRVTNQKSIHLGDFSPGLEAIDHLITRHPHGMLKLAPATQVPASWPCQREWIGARGECKQQLAMFGDLRSEDLRRQVTILADDGTVARFGGNDGVLASFSEQLPAAGEVLLEPHAAFFAAGLVPDFARTHGLSVLSPRCGYCVGEPTEMSPGLSTRFLVEAVYPLDIKKLRAAVMAHDIGELEIKKRGIPADWVARLRRVKTQGTRRLTALVFPFGDRIKVAICQRQS